MEHHVFVVAPPHSGGALLAEALEGVDASPDNASHIRALHEANPQSTFIYIYREPRRVVHELLGDTTSAEQLAQQWNAMTTQVLDDLESLPPERWMVVAYRDLAERPEETIPRIAEFIGVQWNGTLPRRPRTQDAPNAATAAQLDAVDAITHNVAARARDVFAQTPARAAASAFRSVSTPSFAALLHHLGVSLVVSTYQSGRLIFVRAQDETTLNTHFRTFRSPMGIAVRGGRMAIGTERELWDYRNQPAVAQGNNDACFVPRRIHVTGDIRIHEIGFASGELWIVNTRFSTLATLDDDSSFVPRWRPPFVTQLAAEDRCHLNGMAIIGDRVRYATALGATNTAGGWREHKAHGGILLDVDSGEIVLRGLSMPHSPRMYDERFYILESGKGTIATADLVTGHVETIAELPGFTRGLAFAGPFAFVGLSQVRESNIFGGIPLAERVAERQCGVYVIDLRSGNIVAFLRFEGDVREIFDVQIVPARYPELLELNDPLVATSYTVPNEALAEFA